MRTRGTLSGGSTVVYSALGRLREGRKTGLCLLLLLVLLPPQVCSQTPARSQAADAELGIGGTGGSGASISSERDVDDKRLVGLGVVNDLSEFAHGRMM
jgi:hypothetical protein